MKPTGVEDNGNAVEQTRECANVSACEGTVSARSAGLTEVMTRTGEDKSNKIIQ